MKVLLAEDDEGVREGMAELIGERAPVVAVQTVNEALQALGNDQFQLVFADMRLGGDHEGGRRVAEQARARGVPVVLMTGLSTREADRALAGVVPDAVLTKPFALDEALALLDRFLHS